MKIPFILGDDSQNKWWLKFKDVDITKLKKPPTNSKKKGKLDKVYSIENIELQEISLWLMQDNKAVFKGKYGGRGTNQYAIKPGGKSKLQGNKPVSCQWITLKDGRKVCIGDNGKFYLPKINVGAGSDKVSETYREVNVTKDWKKLMSDYTYHVTDEEQRTFDGYQAGGYEAMNSLLRGKKEYESSSVKDIVLEEAKLMDKVISENKINENLLAYRIGNYKNKLSVGDIISDKAFVSTTLDKNSPMLSLKEHVLTGTKNKFVAEIQIPKGTNGVFVGKITGNPTYLDEYELLLGRGTQFKVLSVNGKNIQLEVVK